MRRIALSVWLPFLTFISGEPLVFTAAVGAVGVASLVRSTLMGANHKDGQISIVNLLRTTVIRTSDIHSVEFVRYGVGAIHRLVFRTQDGRLVPANGASVWVWPLVLPIHKPSRYRERVERFLIAAGLKPVIEKK